jgi:aminoglycoside phosphotransferase (APT) family kinase protein
MHSRCACRQAASSRPPILISGGIAVLRASGHRFACRNWPRGVGFCFVATRNAMQSDSRPEAPRRAAGSACCWSLKSRGRRHTLPCSHGKAIPNCFRGRTGGEDDVMARSSEGRLESASRVRPAAEVQIDVPLVRRLVKAQFPQWASLPIEPVESAGWDNTIYRLGAELAVRLPRRRAGADQVSNEHRWLPVLGANLPLAVPVPVGKGAPGQGYPWHWTVCSWLDGELAALAHVTDTRRAALSLASFIAALQAFDSTGGPVHAFHGRLPTRDRVARTAAAVLDKDGFDTQRLLAAWDAALAAPAWTGPPVWMHGDLHPANLLVDQGELTAVIDFGLLGVGDPACDLMVAWTYLPADARPLFRGALMADDATWSRGRGWALQLGLRCAAHSTDNRVLGDIGRRTMAEVLTDFEQGDSRW